MFKDESLQFANSIEVNYIIKSRADRYIAGRTQEDLYPEKHLKKTTWDRLGHFLMPPSYTCAPQVGYTSLGMKDGSFYFQDEFGRRPKDRAEWNAAKATAEEMEAHFQKLIAGKKKKPT